MPAVETLLDAAKRCRIAVDLEQQTVTSSEGHCFGFEMDSFRRECLLAGHDEIDLTLVHEQDIRAYELRTGT
jgi:3-isopropylmalate/(R)-2-methylmalate dehydratase small subunit